MFDSIMTRRSEEIAIDVVNVGVEIKEVYLTSGDDDFLVIVDTPNGDNVAKFALALRFAGKRAHPHGQSLASVRISQADIRASITAPR